MKNTLILWLAICVVLIFGCGNREKQDVLGASGQITSDIITSDIVITSISGPITFTVSPIETSLLSYIISLGWLNPPAHTFPTDHMYFLTADPDEIGSAIPPVFNVYAPADALITSILYQSVSGFENDTQFDYKLFFKHTETFSSYLDHVQELDAEILSKAGTISRGSNTVSISVKAGQILGKGGGKPYMTAVDFGVVNQEYTVTGIINHSKYNDNFLHSDSPIKYYAEPLKSQLYSKVRRSSADKDGKFDFDVLGRLVGNWFAEGANDSNWTKHLAFVYDCREPTHVRVSLGGDLGITGIYGISETGLPSSQLNLRPDPANVTVSTGKVSYPLHYYDPNYKSYGSQNGLVIVQMLDEQTIKVEAFPNSTNETAEFTSNAKTYTR